MPCRNSVLVALLGLGAFPCSQVAAEPKSAPGYSQVRQAIDRSLPYLEKDGVAWWNQRRCNGCHHGPFLVWTHREARARGFAVDRQKLDDWTEQALHFYLTREKDYRAKKTGCWEGASLLLSRPDAPGWGPSADHWRTVAELMLNGQGEPGFWKYEGQPQKRPNPESDEAVTFWALLAAASLEKTDLLFFKGRELARTWLVKHPQGEGNEAAALRLLIEHRFGETARARALAEALVARQNPDGGWAWAKGLPSDSYATGQALYALGGSGFSGEDPAVQRAWEFLLKGQRKDGSWYAPTKKPNARDNPIASYWGSAWATLGLLATLKEPSEIGAASPVKD